MREVQGAGAFGMRIEVDETKGSSSVIFFRNDDVSADILEKSAEIRRLLKLPADQRKFVLVYSPMRGENNELSVDAMYTLMVWSDVAGDPVQDLSDVRQDLFELGIEPTETKSVLDDGTRTVDLEWHPPLDFTLDQGRRLEQLLDRWDAEANMGVEYSDG